MKNSTLMMIVILVVVGGVAAYGLSSQNKVTEADLVSSAETMMKKSDVSAPVGTAGTETTETGAASDDESLSAASRYVTYSQAALDAAAPQRRVLFFYASWCPTCQPADKSFQQNSSQIPEDVVVIRVNYNDNQTDQVEKDLAKKYNVTYQHTYVQIDSEGTEVTKWNGGEIEDLLTNIK